MDKIKIVHAADMHFDTPFKGIGSKQGKISREELKETFKNIVDFCNETNAQIFLIAGDIFDNMTLSKETIFFLEDVFKDLKNTRVFISPGNHDPYNENSFYKLVNWPENVHIFKGSLEKVYLSDLNVNIWGAAFNERYERESLLKSFSVNSDKINILVMHGEVTKGLDKNEYNPISINEIENSNFDYIALGHRHKFSDIKKAGNTFYAYSGCIQGRGFDELEDKGIIYGYIFKHKVELEFKRMSKRNYYVKNIDVSGILGYSELKEKILNAIPQKERMINFYKVIIKGEVSDEFNINEEVIKSKLDDEFYYIKIKDKTSKKIDIDKLCKGYSVKSIFAKYMMKELKNIKNSNLTDIDEQEEVIKMAFKYGIEALTDNEVNSL